MYRSHHVIGLSLACFLVASGCSSHTVRYQTDSEESLQQSRQAVPIEQAIGPSSLSASKSQTFPYHGETVEPGALSPTAPSWPDAPFVAHPSPGHSGSLPYADIRFFEPSKGSFQEGAQYGYAYEGIEGSGTTHGPVTGFSSSDPLQPINPSPEDWARAYLGEEAAPSPHDHSETRSQNSEGHSDTGFGTKKGDLVYPDPETWARGYLRDDRSDETLPLERVDEGTMIAKVHPTYPSGMSEQYEQEPPNAPDFSQPRVHSHDLGFAHATSISARPIEDIYFDFDSWQITERGKHALEADAHWLNVNSAVTVTIEGHCDARGTQDYNLVLGKKRAEAVKAYLVDLGVEPNRISVVSYGEERPFCTASTETCYQQNRRGHFVVKQ